MKKLIWNWTRFNNVAEYIYINKYCTAFEMGGWVSTINKNSKIGMLKNGHTDVLVSFT